MDTFAAKNRGRNGTTSMETQYVHTDWHSIWKRGANFHNVINVYAEE